MFHMQCIQKWVREGIYQHAYKSPDGETPSKDIPWHWYYTPLHLILFYFQKFFFLDTYIYKVNLLLQS